VLIPPVALETQGGQ